MRWTHFAVISAAAAAVTSMFTTAGFADVSSHIAAAVRTAILLALSLAILVYSGEHERLPSVTPRTWAFLGLSGLATSLTLIIAGALLAASAR
jgi:bacterial/archaeal transporter family protein